MKAVLIQFVQTAADAVEVRLSLADDDEPSTATEKEQETARAAFELVRSHVLPHLARRMDAIKTLPQSLAAKAKLN